MEATCSLWLLTSGLLESRSLNRCLNPMPTMAGSLEHRSLTVALNSLPGAMFHAQVRWDKQGALNKPGYIHCCSALGV